MSLVVERGAMLLGLLGLAIPVVIHLLDRRRDPTIPWGAMAFLDAGRLARRWSRLSERFLLPARMGVLALVALALARPAWAPGGSAVGASPAGPREVVLIVDGSASMGRRAGATTPRSEAIAWARRLVDGLEPGDSVAVLRAGDRVDTPVEPPGLDRDEVDDALAGLPDARGSSDLPAALAGAFRLLERPGRSRRDVVVLGDGRRSAWRPDEPARWALLRDLHRRLPDPPRIWALDCGGGATPDGPNARVGPLDVAPDPVAPGLPIEVEADVHNDGPGPDARTADLLVDGATVPGSGLALGPIPAGGKARARFRATIEVPGPHVLTVRLAPDSGLDPLPLDDASSRPVEVAAALPVLVVDGDPDPEPFAGESDLLRAALTPADDPAPTFDVATIAPDALGPEALRGRRLLVLADIERLDPTQAEAVGRFAAEGGGVLVLPGDRLDAEAANIDLHREGGGWLPARLGPLRGRFGRLEPDAARPDPSTFDGPLMARFGGDDAPLGSARLFAHRVLTPSARPPAASVAARLVAGDPWIVERPHGRGLVAVLAGPLDARGGTLPANPDFVPWIHDLALHLAGARNGRPLPAGKAWTLDLDPPPGRSSLAVRTPTGSTIEAPIERRAGRARVRLEATVGPGLYRVDLPDGPAHVAFEPDPLEADPTPLAPAEAERLAEGWPLAFEADPLGLTDRLTAAPANDVRREFWRPLIAIALAGLCAETWMTRKLAKGQSG